MLAKGKLAGAGCSDSLGCSDTVFEVSPLVAPISPTPLFLWASWTDSDAGVSVGNIVLGESIIEVLGSIGVESLESITVALSPLGLRPLDLGLVPALGLLFRT
jgi:hypothetical protein